MPLAGDTIRPVALTGVYKNMARGIIALVFRCEVLGGQLALNDEVSGFQWATPAEVKEMADEAFAVRVLDALSEQPYPAIRQHDGVRVKLPVIRQEMCDACLPVDVRHMV
jgi:8-oxo-dGTP diphosphatase